MLRCSLPAGLRRIFRRVARRPIDRWRCLWVLFGIIFGLALSIVLQTHQCQFVAANDPDLLAHYPAQGRETKTALDLLNKQVEYQRMQETLKHTACVIRQLRHQYNLPSPEQVLKSSSNPAMLNDSGLICLQEAHSAEVGVAEVQSWVYYADHSSYYDGHTEPRTDYPPWHTKPISRIVKRLQLDFADILHWPLQANFTSYARYNVNRGVEYLLDIEQKKLPPSGGIDKNRVSLLRQFSQFSVRETAEFLNRRVHFVVPLSSRQSTVEPFLAMYERICLSTKQNTSLILSVYGEEAYITVTTMINHYQKKYPNAMFMVLKGEGTFSRSRALNLGMQKLKVNDLAFHCDVDIEITDPSFLDRCRMNTVEGKRVYFPELFKHYNLDLVFQYKKRPEGKLPIRRDTGHWGAYGYGMVCIYKADFISAGYMDGTIEGWGLEDVDFFNRVRHKRIIFRAPDPALQHRWHPKNCSAITTAEKYNDCQSSKILGLGGREELGRHILELEEDN